MDENVSFLLRHEAGLRLAAFVLVLGAMATWEAARPRRALRLPRLRRWAANLGIVAVDTLAVRLALPLLAVGAALEAEARGWGLFNALAWPAWAALVPAVLLLDLVIYGQHVAMHKVAPLWRLHRVHHSDTDIDVSTGFRFHPFEILLSMLIKVAAVMALGAPAAAVIAFELILNGMAMFNHSNVYLPPAADRWLRRVLVTPDMHRVHHSIHRVETDSNYGFNLSWWDRLFRTYRAQPRDGHPGMTIGLPIFRDRRSLDLHWLLIQPFVDPKEPLR